MVKSILPFSLVMVFLTACSDTTLGTRSFEESVDQITIPGGPVDLGMLSLEAIRVPLDLKDQEGYSALSIVTSVHVRSARFTVSATSDDPTFDPFADSNQDNFDFLSTVVLSLQATIDGTSRTTRVASLPEGDPQVGSNTTVLNLLVDDVDIRDFVEAQDVQLVISATGTNPQDYVAIDPVIRFRVGFGIR